MFEWISAHWRDVVIVLGAMHMVAEIAVKWTPSTKDDEILTRVWSLVSKFLGSTDPKGK